MTQPNAALLYLNEHLRDVTDQCMVWPFSRNPTTGYGRLQVCGRRVTVHVLACEVWHGPRPEGTQAAHGPCHDRGCWNGQHLSWRTPAQNSADKERDGTLLRGEAHYRARLTAAQVLDLRARHAAGGVTLAELGRAHGVDYCTVRDVVRRVTWKHV